MVHYLITILICSNCTSNTIQEKIYDSLLPGDKLIDLVETMDEKIVNNITPG
jgi:alcohol-forming fatty acyl-CoA reductase